MDVMAMAHDERAEMADFLESLAAEQWEHPSLCRGWRIRDVAAHVISYEEHGPPDLAATDVVAHPTVPTSHRSRLADSRHWLTNRPGLLGRVAARARFFTEIAL